MLGIAFGALFGWLGSDKINAWLTKVSTGITDAWNKVKETFGVPTLYTEADDETLELVLTGIWEDLESNGGFGEFAQYGINVGEA